MPPLLVDDKSHLGRVSLRVSYGYYGVLYGSLMFIEHPLVMRPGLHPTPDREITRPMKSLSRKAISEAFLVKWGGGGRVGVLQSLPADLFKRYNWGI